LSNRAFMTSVSLTFEPLDRCATLTWLSVNINLVCDRDDDQSNAYFKVLHTTLDISLDPGE
jgi:hypothetical protein